MSENIQPVSASVITFSSNIRATYTLCNHSDDIRVPISNMLSFDEEYEFHYIHLILGFRYL